RWLGWEERERLASYSAQCCALARVGREGEARELFCTMLNHRTASGLLSEDMDFETGELWGNFPQTYSLVGVINCAGLLSKSWNEVR
ncbi:MAG: hypothetical protein COW16_04695, partial [Sphingomonadales bacterium CG12_big_fil_rev_8_21_14_0_65_65_10]